MTKQELDTLKALYTKMQTEIESMDIDDAIDTFSEFADDPDETIETVLANLACIKDYVIDCMPEK